MILRRSRAVIALRAANDKTTGGIDEILGLPGQHLVRQNLPVTSSMMKTEISECFTSGVCWVETTTIGNANWLAAFINDRDL